MTKAVGPALAIGGITAAVLIAVDLITSLSVDIKTAAGIMVFVGSLVWWLGRELQGIKDTLKDHGERLNRLPCSSPDCGDKHSK